MDIESIINKFVAHEYSESEIRKNIDKYLSIKLTLPVTDEPMQRLSQVLTNNKYITLETCDGHGKEYPEILLYTKSQSHLRHLAHILARDSIATNYKWTLTVWSLNPLTSPKDHLYFILQPEISKQSINPQTNYAKLLQDLDIIGLYVMNYFNNNKKKSG
ncbi:MAG: hypothetical protein ACP5N2_00200 [Candidatus Nanoarchaeia archaeon]